jgi:hypothetical protein
VTNCIRSLDKWIIDSIDVSVSNHDEIYYKIKMLTKLFIPIKMRIMNCKILELRL